MLRSQALSKNSLYASRPTLAPLFYNRFFTNLTPCLVCMVLVKLFHHKDKMLYHQHLAYVPRKEGGINPIKCLSLERNMSTRRFFSPHHPFRDESQVKKLVHSIFKFFVSQTMKINFKGLPTVKQ